jgi:hypothetical protein
MRRAICQTEPNQTYAGDVNTWKFIYTPAQNLPKGTLLKFNLNSPGRDIDWQLPSVDLNETSNVIYGRFESGDTIPAKLVEYQDRFAPDYEFVLNADVPAGVPFSIIVGSPKLQKPLQTKNGTKAQLFAERRRTFILHVDPTGKGVYEEEEHFNLDVKGGKLSLIRILTPSFVTKNKRFDIVVRFEDENGNLTNNAEENTLIELTYEQLRENLNWKLFVPETGFITLPNLYFNEAGTYTITLKVNTMKEVFKSAPIKCFNDNKKNLFWGLLHGESERIDSTDNIEACLRHFRDERAFHFYAPSNFESVEETSNETWKLISQNVTDFDENDRFTTFLGFQWHGDKPDEGIRQFIWAKDNKPILRKKDVKNSSLKKLYKSLAPKEAISIPCFTMGKGLSCDFSDFNPDFERVVEIYNAWGSSECLTKQGNLTPITGGKKAIKETAEGSIQKALNRNLRFGFCAGGLDDRGVYADFFENGQEQYPPGLTGIVAEEQSRTSLFEALYNRACFATTGKRIIVGLELAQAKMGSEIKTLDKPGLLVNRHLSFYVAGTAKIHKIEIIRNGDVIHTVEPKEYFYDGTYDDLTPLTKVTIDAGDKKPPFVYYYIRVLQEDGHMAWSSPIWVDYLPVPPGIRKATGKALKPLKKEVELLIEEEDDEEDEVEDEFTESDEE